MENIILKPVITEKMTAISEKENKYGFIVSKNANKIQIKKAIEANYGVSVKDISTLVQAGKSKTRYTKTSVQKGRTSSYKKAIITLAEGDVIDIYSNI